MKCVGHVAPPTRIRRVSEPKAPFVPRSSVAACESSRWRLKEHEQTQWFRVVAARGPLRLRLPLFRKRFRPKWAKNLAYRGGGRAWVSETREKARETDFEDRPIGWPVGAESGRARDRRRARPSILTLAAASCGSDPPPPTSAPGAGPASGGELDRVASLRARNLQPLPAERRERRRGSGHAAHAGAPRSRQPRHRRTRAVARRGLVARGGRRDVHAHDSRRREVLRRPTPHRRRRPVLVPGGVRREGEERAGGGAASQRQAAPGRGRSTRAR